MLKTTEVPMPNTAHPGLEQYADAVRTATVETVLLPRSVGAAAYKDESIAPVAMSPRPMVLTKNKAGGGAPFVGDPILNDARYFWWVWTDEIGRASCRERVLYTV